MKKITVLINGKSEVTDLQESLIVTHDNPFILVKKTIFWNYDNISSSNNKLTYNSGKTTLGEGYWIFTMLKKEIESYGTVGLESNEYDDTCSITSDNTINLQNFGPFLVSTGIKPSTPIQRLKAGQ